MTIDMPTTPGFVSVRFGLQTNTQTFVSPLNNAMQRVLLSGAQWMSTYTLPPMNRVQAALWKAFFLSLDGRAGTFNAYDPDFVTPRGSAGGTPLVNGGSQTGSSLSIDGCTANVTNWLMAGDYFSVGGELKMLTSNASTNGSGQAMLNFKPALRNSPADNTAIITSKPTCTMALVDDSQSMWTTDKMRIHQPITFSGIEVFS